MPVYNVKSFLEECVISIINQTHQNIEIILVDDGSSVLCDELALKDKRIKVFHTINHSVSYTRNYAISQCSGRYVFPVDGDDVIMPIYVEKAVKILESNRNIGIVYCEVEFFGARKGKCDLPSFILSRMLLSNVIFVTALFRKSDWEQVGGFSETMVSGIEDYDFWLSILTLKREVYRIPEVLFHYRLCENSRSKNFEKDRENLFNMYKVIHNRHKQLYVDNYEIFTTEMRRALIDEQYKLKKIKILNLFISIVKRYPCLKQFVKRSVLTVW